MHILAWLQAKYNIFSSDHELSLQIIRTHNGVLDALPAGDAPVLFRVHSNVDVAPGRGPAAATEDTQENGESSPNDVGSSSNEDLPPRKQPKTARKRPNRVMDDDDEWAWGTDNIRPWDLLS